MKKPKLTLSTHLRPILALALIGAATVQAAVMRPQTECQQHFFGLNSQA